MKIVLIKRFLTGFFCLALTGTNVYSFEDLKITSDQAVINEYSNSLTLLGNVLIKRLADGVTLKSESLIVNRDENNQRIVKAEARGNVVLEEPGRSLSSQKIYFDRLLHQIDLTGHVIVSSENYLLRGDRFSYDYKEKQGKLIPLPGAQVVFFYFKRDIKNKLEDESTGQKPDMKATANEIFINDALKIMILHGDVVMDHQQENAKFFADRTEIHYNPDNQFKELVATGNFILEQKGRHSSADRAVYDMIKEVVTLLGNAEVREKGQGAVRSSKIVMNIDIAKGILKGEEDIPVRFEIPLD